jgi:hypothetical protein
MNKGIPQFSLESKIIAPILPRILKLGKFEMLQVLLMCIYSPCIFVRNSDLSHK